MSITDELRDWCVDRVFMGNGYAEVLGIADRIDAAHRAALEKLAAQLDETSDMRDFIGRIEQAATNREDVTLWGVDYTPLPVDADGVPIHVGDRVENNERVERIVLTDGSWEPSVYVEKLPNVLHEHFCHEISHYHTPTVEDMLREFADIVRKEQVELAPISEETIAEFASKLRMADEVDA